MEPLKIWHAPVQGYAEIVEDPQVKHMKSLSRLPARARPGAPVTLVNHPVLYDGATPPCACLPNRSAPRRRGAEGARALNEPRSSARQDRVVNALPGE